MSILEEMHKPDILDCISHLSSDEVFTPPKLVNQILDILPQELFKSPDTKFLDPCCKSGVFLREIAKRLIDGLEDKIPNLDERVEHIFKNQLYGLAITELTALLSRRSVYCSKDASGEYSVANFDNNDGNIEYKRTYHLWLKDKCMMCGASKSEYDRADILETHAYSFIHTDEIRNKELFERLKNMKFDVIIGNPPYQLSTSGDDNGAQAKPIYQLFVQQAIKLNPRYISMITPSRWFAGGWGLDNFRNDMITSNKLVEIHDFKNSTDCFSGVDIKGGISYFLYSSDYNGMCKFYSHENGEITSMCERYLKEEGCDILIRMNELITIYHKVINKQNFIPYSNIVSGRSPYGLNTNHYGNKTKISSDDVPYFERTGWTYMPKKNITRNIDTIDKYKLYVPKAAEDGKLPGKVIGNITGGLPGTICSGTYLLVGPFETKIEFINAKKYMKTKFFRVLVAIHKISQDAASKVYSCVPMQDFNEEWTDEKLYKKYGLTQEEIDFIESMIRPMD